MSAKTDVQFYLYLKTALLIAYGQGLNGDITYTAGDRAARLYTLLHDKYVIIPKMED